jgi:hypothetical protein
MMTDFWRVVMIALMMGASVERRFELHRTTRRYIAEDSHLHTLLAPFKLERWRFYSLALSPGIANKMSCS